MAFGEDLVEADLARLLAGQRLGLQPLAALLRRAGAPRARSRPPRPARRPRRRRRARAPRPGRRDAASSTRSPVKSSIARTLPQCAPATSASPTCSVPRWTSTVATGPRPGRAATRSRRPTPGPSGWPSAPRARRPAGSSRAGCRGPPWSWRRRRRRSCRRPSPRGSSPCEASSLRTRSGWAPCLSILLTATRIGTSGRPGVVDRLDRLRHHAVVGRHHDHRDVGDLGAAGAHRGERLVARRVEEGDPSCRRGGPGRRRCAG